MGSGNKKSCRTIGNWQSWLRFSVISSVLFSTSCSENSDFSRTKELLMERLDSNNRAGLNKHRIGCSASKINNRTDPN